MLSLPDPGLLRELRSQHRAIVEHVIAKEQNKADDVLRHHLQLALSALQSLEQRYPDYFILDDAE